MKGFMKRILMLSSVLVFGAAIPCSAQNNGLPGAAPAVADNPAVPGEPPKATSSRSRRPSTAPGGMLSEATQFTVAKSFSSKNSRGDSIPPVIIRFTETDAKANADLEQDLYVMARVLSRMLERADNDHIEYKMKVPMLLTGAGKSVRPMYIEGTGPLFMVKVNFPLMSAPKTPVKAVKQTPDSEWNEAERDLYGAGTVDSGDDDGGNANYNEDQVEMLKREIITALKNAANIRGLKADEFVNVTVFGQSVPRSRATSSRGDGKDIQLGLVSGSVYESGSGGKGTVLSLRARKADIDAFSSGKLEYDSFKTKVSTAAYIGSGAGMTSINSWLQESNGRYRQ
jgi:hypothetical protein